jgi:ribosomal protein S13
VKFEQVLQIYWTKGFLVGGKVLSFGINTYSLRQSIPGMGNFHLNLLLKRFDLNILLRDKKLPLSYLSKDTRRSINRILSQVFSINYNIMDVNRLNVIRLFLIKSYRGKAHALGKPSRGQRTWSNAWTAYSNNKTLRTFLAECQKKLALEKKEEKINYKVLKKLTSRPKTDRKVQKIIKKKNTWF